MRFSVALNILAIVVNVGAFMLHTVAGNIIGCLVALGFICACFAVLMTLREIRTREGRHRA